jgi:hypothetical protein
MCWRAWNKMLVISFSAAAAGILACIAALLDILVPKGSALGFLAWTAALVVAIVLVVSGYVWACDKCEDYLNGRLDRIRNMKQQTPRQVTDQGKEEARVPPEADQRPDALRFSQPGATADHYVAGLRGSVSPNGDSRRAVATKKLWHGQ